MKKASLLSVVLLLCVSLSACVVRLPGVVGDSSVIQQQIPAESSFEGSETSAEEEVPHLSKLCGEWCVLEREDLGKIASLTIREDKTAVCGDRFFTWAFHMQNGKNVWITLFDGENEVGRFWLMLLDGNDIKGRIELNDADLSAYLYKPSHYEFAEITLDNWQEYFEIVGYMTFRDNAFGEAESCFFRKELRLKEEYWGKYSAELMYDPFDKNVIEEGALEFFYVTGECPAEIDLENRTWAFGEFAAKEGSVEVTGFTYNSESGYIYAVLETDGILPSEIKEGLLTSVRGLFEMQRIRLTLCLIAE